MSKNNKEKNFKDKFMGFFVSDEFDENDEYEPMDDMEQEYEEDNQSYSNNDMNNNTKYTRANSQTSTRNTNSVNFQNSGQLRVRVAKPERFEEAKEIANYLNDKYTVVLNLESATKDLSRRLIDFLSGVAYANNGRIKAVANNTFIITPHNVDVTGDDLWQTYETEEEYMN